MDKIINTAELFRLVSLSIGKEKEATIYMVAKTLGVTYTSAKMWAAGLTVMDDKYAEKVASLLGLDLEYVIFCLEAERRHKSGMDKIAALFERAALASQSRAAAAILLILMGSTTLPRSAEAATDLVRPSHNVCILC
jgi:hypothetical protein